MCGDLMKKEMDGKFEIVMDMKNLKKFVKHVSQIAIEETLNDYPRILFFGKKRLCNKITKEAMKDIKEI